MNVKSLGKSAAKFDALGSLARTDDMLAVIGLIMLVGVIISSYGAYWQGRLAAAQYNKECSQSSQATSQEEELAKNRRFTIIMVVVSALILGLIIYIFRAGIKKAVTNAE
jgi:predicted histidine transporter YuiF (NhaC family)